MALEYGLLVYAFEQVDQNNDLEMPRIASSDSYMPKMESNFPGGVVTRSNEKIESGSILQLVEWRNRQNESLGTVRQGINEIEYNLLQI